jgi:hypothetical protein
MLTTLLPLRNGLSFEQGGSSRWRGAALSTLLNEQQLSMRAISRSNDGNISVVGLSETAPSRSADKVADIADSKPLYQLHRQTLAIQLVFSCEYRDRAFSAD